ncbi:hypothetical protein U0070_007224 [Myodes glareolus]|uniref:Uncharacterized protein n=1 Tax=Myodes glareolus TaxID=447135 RepID=A0AAW0JSY0_MYOGA
MQRTVPMKEPSTADYTNGKMTPTALLFQQTIEIVKPADHPFPAPLEEGISLDIFSAFIEPSPTPETERKVGLMLPFLALLSKHYTGTRRKELHVLPLSSPLTLSWPTEIFSSEALDQEESPQEPQSESEAAEVDPLVGFTIDDVKSALARVTDEVLLNIQVLRMGSELRTVLGESVSARPASTSVGFELEKSGLEKSSKVVDSESLGCSEDRWEEVILESREEKEEKEEEEKEKEDEGKEGKEREEEPSNKVHA